MRRPIRSLQPLAAAGWIAAACSRPAPVVPPAPVPRLALAPCRLPNVDRDARCGTLEVFEDRNARTGRKIGLRVVVLPATGASPRPDPVFWLHGGPGAAATAAAPAARGGFLEPLAAEHDLVFVDQRGTGASNPLPCDFADDPADLARFFGELFPAERIRDCRRRLEVAADLRLYTTPLAMDDLDDVRASLGYDKIDLVAASYGTIAAQVYLRQHPDHVRSAFLLGVANTNVRQPLPFARGAQLALDRLVVDCTADATCHAAFPRFAQELAALLSQFDHGPVTAELVEPATHARRQIAIVRENFVEQLRLLLYATTSSAFIPLVVHRAFAGDWVPFEALAIASHPGRLLARGMYLSVTCSESVPFITPRDIAESSAGTFVGEGRVRVHIAACRDWPRGAISPDYVSPVVSSAPVLMISGQLDASTPPSLGKEVLGALSEGRQIEIRDAGHQIDSPCVWKILAEFIARGSARALDASCVDEIRRPPFAVEVPPELSLSG